MTGKPISNGVFGVERPVSRSSTSSSCAPNEDGVGSKYSQLYFHIQKLEDNEQFEEGIRLRWDALMMMLDDGLLHTNPTSLAADVDEYIRRVNFTALIHINKRRFRDAERLLIGAQQLVVDAPTVVLFNDAVPSLKAIKRRCLAVIENNLGLCDFKAGRFANAEVHFFTAASMEEELPTADNPGATLFNLARVQQSLGKHSVALDCAAAATEHLRAKYQTVGLLMVQIDEIRQLLVHCLALQADAATSAHRYPVALDALSEAIKVASEGHREEAASLIESLKQQRLVCEAAGRRFRAKKELDKRYPKRAASEEASRRCHTIGKRPVNEQLTPYLIRDKVATSCLPNDGPLHRHLELSNHNFQMLQRKQMHSHDDDASLQHLSTPQPLATHRTPSATRAARVICERKASRAATSSFESYLSGAGGINMTTSPHTEQPTQQQQQNDIHQQKPPLHVPTRPRSATTNTAPISSSTLPQLSAKGSSRPTSSDRYIRSHHSNTELLHAASESLIKRSGRSSYDQENGSVFPLDASDPAYFTHQPGLKAVYNSLKDEDRQAFNELSKVPVRPDTAPLARYTARPSTASHTVRPPHIPKEGLKSRPYSQAARRPLSASTSRSASASSRKSSPISNREGSLSKSEMHKKFMKLTQSDAAFENALEYHKRLIAVDIIHATAAGYKARLRCALTQHQQKLALSRLRAAIRAEVREEERVSTCRVTDALVASRNIKIAQLEARLKEADDLLQAEAARVEEFEAIQEQQKRDDEVRVKQLEDEAKEAAALQSTIESIASEKHELDESDVTVVQTWVRAKHSKHHIRSVADRARSSMLAVWSEKKRVEVAFKTLKRLEPDMVVAIRTRKLQSDEELSRERYIVAEETVSAAIHEALMKELEDARKQEEYKAAKLVVERCLFGWFATQNVQKQAHKLKEERENLSARCIQRFMCMAVAVSQRKKLHSRWIEEIYHNKHDYAATKIQSTWRMSRCYRTMQQPLKAHSEKLQVNALKEARRLRQIASIPRIQRAYRCHLARRLVAYAMQRRQEAKMKYVLDQMQLDAVLTLQRFARIVRAKGIVRRQRYVMSNIIRYREYQRARLLEEECSRRTTHIAITLLQRCGRGAQVRFALRRYRVRRVADFENENRK